MKRPETETQLWYYVHRLFGIGDWDEDSGVPWWRYVQTEVMKVKAKRKKLGASTEALADAADYCKAHQIDIRNVAWLYRYLGPSRAWHDERRRALSAAAIDELIDGAVEQDLTMGGEWVERLIRARGEYRQEVYEAWKAARTAAPR